MNYDPSGLAGLGIIGIIVIVIIYIVVVVVSLLITWAIIRSAVASALKKHQLWLEQRHPGQ